MSGPRDVVLALDQGTTNAKAVLVDGDGVVRSSGSCPVRLNTPRPGWVEQDPSQIWASALTAIATCVAGSTDRIVGIALSTQRETVVGWRASSGVPVGPALTWQDQRTTAWCAKHLGPEADEQVRYRTGLRVDAMFSAPKMAWLLGQHPEARNDLVLGTVDAWLVHCLTAGRVRATEAGNASRTLLYDINELAWSTALLDLFGVPGEVLPEVRASDAGYGVTRDVPGLDDGLPIAAVLADSHAALLGHGCSPGTAKATYGTGTSVMAPVTTAATVNRSSVPTTLAWLDGNGPVYAREGNIISSGSTLVWTATLLGVDVADLLGLAASVTDSNGVTFLPAFTGLGAPHWDRARQASIVGMSAQTTRAHVARAAVDAVAHQVCDVVDVVQRERLPLESLRADGGASASPLVMQTQADLLGLPVDVAPLPEVSALGASMLAWKRLGHDLVPTYASARRIEPCGVDREARRATWRSVVTPAGDEAR